MARILPLWLPRVRDQWSPPVKTEQFPGTAPRFLHGDPRSVVPEACAALSSAKGGLLPFGADQGDLLLAPMPRPGEESASLLEVLEQLAPHHAVLFFSRDLPVFGNVRCEQEELLLLPAERMRHLLRASMWTEKRPGPQGSLLNRVFLSLLLDHWRSLILVDSWAEHPRLVGEVRLAGELDLLPGARASELFAGSHAWRESRPARVHLPWWAGRRILDWKMNAILARQWPNDWAEVEVQVQVGRRYRRVAAAEYFACFRRSGAQKRLLIGGPQLGSEELAALAQTASEDIA